MTSKHIVSIVWILVLSAVQAPAQWQTQSITLQPGWNPVYLVVKPEPADCDTVFQDRPEILSVWKWTRNISTAEFDVDPALVFPDPDHWAAWFPTNHPHCQVRTLSSLQSSRSYLIHVDTNATAFTWTFKGRPAVPMVEWLPNAFNLVGMPVHPALPATFADYFAACPQVNAAMGANQIYTIDTRGQEFPVRNTARDTIQPGQAYWIKCGNVSDYSGPIAIVGDVDFGRTLQEQEISLQNLYSNRSLTVTLKQIASETPPSGQPEMAGPVPLSYFYSNLASNEWGWRNFPAGGLTQILAPRATWNLRLGLRRADLNPYTPIGTNGAAYQGILQACDSGQSLLYRIPARAESETVHLRAALDQTGSGLPTNNPYQGLWVGNVTLNLVGTNSSLYAPLNTAIPFSFRLIFFVDAYGDPFLMQRVLLAGTETTETNIQQNSYGDWTTSVVVRVDYQLYSGEGLVPSTATEVYRISSAAFPAHPDGTYFYTPGTFGTNLNGSFTLDYNDPINPFKHAYHPDHDNLDSDFSTLLPAGVESYTINRSFVMTFTNNAVMDSPFWGVSEVGGTYFESISGLNGMSIYAAGPFTLQRISTLGTLNPY